jgi:hypothetical protein
VTVTATKQAEAQLPPTRSATRRTDAAGVGVLTLDWIDQEIARLRLAVEQDARLRASRDEKAMLFIRWFCYAALVLIGFVEIMKALS